MVKCPYCGTKNVARIVYGYMDIDSEIQEKLDQGKITLGGCCVTGMDPDYSCNECHEMFYKGGRKEFFDADELEKIIADEKKRSQETKKDAD